MHAPRVGAVKDYRFDNHLYGIFTAAKEKVVQAGRLLAATKYLPPERHEVKGDTERKRERENERQRIREKKKKRPRRRGKKKKAEKQDDLPLAVVTIDVRKGEGGGTVVTVRNAKPTLPSPILTGMESDSQTDAYIKPRKKKSARL